MATTDLSDLVDAPRETLEIEIKKWMDLDDRTVRAKLSRHAAALANHGGGYIVFGFNDDLSEDLDRPTSLEAYSRNTFTGILRRYLSPLFQCKVTLVESRLGRSFPILRIPSHEKTPIIAKADGPSDNRGRPQGIQAGYCYVRKPGPESARAVGDEDWVPLLRRCLLNDREGLLRDIASLVNSGSNSEATLKDRLDTWHSESEKKFLSALSRATSFVWPVDLASNYYQLSYLISDPEGQPISGPPLLKTLEEVNNEVRAIVWTGWSMLYPFKREEIAPAVHPEHGDGTGIDALEANLIGEGLFDTSLPDFWRVSADGRASILRAYREDRQRTVDSTGRPAGTWLSPETVLRALDSCGPALVRGMSPKFVKL